MSFRDLLRQQKDKIFEELGEDAVLQGPFPDCKIRVMRGKEIAENSLYGQATESDIGLFRIRVSEAPDLKKGYRVILDGEVFTLSRSPIKIDRGLIWEVEAPPDA